MSDWPILAIEQYPVEVIDGDRGSEYPKIADFAASGYCLFLNAGNVTAGGFALEQCAFISPERDSLLRKGRLARNDIVLTTRGTVGNFAFFDARVPFEHVRINSGMVILRADPSKLMPRYFYFAVQSPTFRHQIRALTSGSAQPQLPIRDIKKLRLPLPPMIVQEGIVEVVGAIQDKIELNRRMNETLEAMAQAIFRDWFVDFGPTRRKIDGATDPVEIMGGLVADPERARELAELFPASIGDDGLPEGWEMKGLDQIADFLNGLALQKHPGEGEDDSLPVIKIAELRNGVTSKTNRASRTVPAKYVIKDGDFLFSWSGSLMAKFWTEGEGALNQHLFKVSSSDVPSWFYSLWVQHYMTDFQQIAASKATTMGHIQRGHLRSAMTVCPPSKLIEAMTPVLGPLVERTVHNALENRTLATTRDLLLPKLMSGEIRLDDARAQAEEAA